ncbi:hypothetical protein, partial [Streptomyces chartreusis]
QVLGQRLPGRDLSGQDPFAVLAELVVDESVAADWCALLMDLVLVGSLTDNESADGWDGFDLTGTVVEGVVSEADPAGTGPGGGAHRNGTEMHDFDWNDVQAQLGSRPDGESVTASHQNSTDSAFAELDIPFGTNRAGPPRMARKRKWHREEDDLRLIGTALTHPELTMSQLAHHYNWQMPILCMVYEQLGSRLNFSGTGEEVLGYIRQRVADFLPLASSNDGTLLEISYHAAIELSTLDKQLIGTALTHSELTIAALARRYNWQPPALALAYERIGTWFNISGGGGEVLAYIRQRPADFLPLSSPNYGMLPELSRHAGSELTALDKQLIGTALTHRELTIVALARHYNWQRDYLDDAYSRLGQHLNHPGTGKEVLDHIRQRPTDFLPLASSNDGTLPEIPHHTNAKLTALDKQLIGTALTHRELTIAALARHYNWQPSSLQKAYVRLGRRLNFTGAANEVPKYLRQRVSDLLPLASSNDGTLLEIPHHTATELDDQDRQLIGTALTHRELTIPALARHYNWQRGKLIDAYSRLGQHLNHPGTGKEVLDHIRQRAADFLPLTSSNDGTLPEIPHHTNTKLTALDKQLIGTALTHRKLNVSELAHHYNWEQSKLRMAYDRLGRRLNYSGTGGEVLEYIREQPADFLPLASSNDGSLPEIPRRTNTPSW